MAGNQNVIQSVIQRFHGTHSGGQAGVPSFGQSGNPNTVYNQSQSSPPPTTGVGRSGWLSDFLNGFLGRGRGGTPGNPSNPPPGGGEGGGSPGNGGGTGQNPGAPPPPGNNGGGIFDQLGDLSDWQQWLDLFVPGDLWDSRNNAWNVTGIAQAVANSLGIPITDGMMNTLVDDLTEEQIENLPGFLKKIVRAARRQRQRQRSNEGGGRGEGGQADAGRGNGLDHFQMLHRFGPGAFARDGGWGTVGRIIPVGIRPQDTQPDEATN